MARLHLNEREVRRVPQKAAKKLVTDVVTDVYDAGRLVLTEHYSSGQTLRRYKKKIIVRDGLVFGWVGSSTDAAYWLHEGTKPHRIRLADTPGRKQLHFFWKKKGRWVFFHHVNHPGQKKLGYLTGPLRLAARKHGFRVVITR